MRELDPDTVESSELIEEAFKFWFEDHDHIRSPFPSYIHTELKHLSVDKFYKWAADLDEKARDEINDTKVGERLEEIIFETALELVKTEDEKLTIFYPFMPRVNDKVYPGKNAGIDVDEPSIVKERQVTKEGDNVYMEVKFESLESKRTWKTQFELPG